MSAHSVANSQASLQWAVPQLAASRQPPRMLSRVSGLFVRCACQIESISAILLIVNLPTSKSCFDCDFSLSSARPAAAMARSRSRSLTRDRSRDRKRDRSRSRSRDRSRDAKRYREDREERRGDYRSERVDRERERCARQPGVSNGSSSGGGSGRAVAASSSRRQEIWLQLCLASR